MEKKRICVRGDSLVWGAWDREMLGWTNRLRYYFDNKKERYSDIYSIGISGNTSKDLLERFDTEAKIRISKTRTNIFIFEIGLNDAQYLIDKQDRRIPLSQFEDNLRSLYFSAQKFATLIIFLGITNIDEKKTVPTSWNANHAFYTKDVSVYNQKLQNFCKDNEIPFIDVFSLLDPNDLEDGCHPNAQGHEKIYSEVRDFLIDNKFV